MGPAVGAWKLLAPALSPRPTAWATAAPALLPRGSSFPGAPLPADVSRGRPSSLLKVSEGLSMLLPVSHVWVFALCIKTSEALKGGQSCKPSI